MKETFRLQSNWRFQSYVPDMEEKAASDLFRPSRVRRLAGLPLAEQWPHLPVYLGNPDSPPSDFSCAPIIGRFAISPRVYEDTVMRSILEAAGELLPMTVTESGAVWRLFSLLPRSHCLDVVDEANCERDRSKNVINFSFRQDKLPDGGIFSMPKHIHAYAVHDEQLPAERDFIQWYRRQGYTGLVFEEQIGAPRV
jgi:hypothetical protein